MGTRRNDAGQCGTADARKIPNIRLECDWCGEVPPWLYLPHRKTGVFCQACVVDVLNPPAPIQRRVCDGQEADGFVEISKKLDAYLATRPKEPAFRVRGKPDRETAVAQPCPDRITRTDRVRIVRHDGGFRGGRAQLWNILLALDSGTVGEVLHSAHQAGLTNIGALMSALRHMAKTYGVLAIEPDPEAKPMPREPQGPVAARDRNWRHFSRMDRVCVTYERTFRGVRARVWGVIRESDGATVGEILARCVVAGVPEGKAVATIRRMLVVYRVLAFQKAQPV